MPRGGVLALTDPTFRVAAKGATLVLRRGDEDARRVPITELERVMVFGRVDLTSGAILSCLKAGVDVVYLTVGGKYRGRLAGPASRNSPLRMAQFAAALDEGRALEVARGFVRGKLTNQRRLLLRWQRERRDPGLEEAAAGLRRLLGKIDATADRNELRGLEGAAAAAYFGGFGRSFLTSDLEFTTRRRRPPPDPVNALLSFGYAVLAAQVEGAVAAAGFDPLAGYLHETAYGRPSLALDLMEEFRPVVVDRLVVRLINRRQIGPGDFRVLDAEEREEDAEDGEAGAAAGSAVHLRDPGRRVFLSALFGRLREPFRYPRAGVRLELRAIVERQAYHLARTLEDGSGYEPFVPR